MTNQDMWTLDNLIEQYGGNAVMQRVRQVIEQRKEIVFPDDCRAKTMADLITPRQMVAIRAIGNSNRVDFETVCKEKTGLELIELSRKAASCLIDYLKAN